MPGSPLSLLHFLLIALGGLGVYFLLPRGPGSEAPAWRWIGGSLAAVALVGLFRTFGAWLGTQTESGLVLGLGLVSIASAGMMISSRNPVYSALWFALILLSNSGLYLHGGAQFLAASTVIVYAGAIIVTFLFVIMLAQPRGTARYDRYSREPFLACVAGVIMLGTLLGVVQASSTTEREPGRTAAARVPTAETIAAENARSGALTLPADPKDHVVAIGKSLFEEHAVSIELIGMLLLVAVIGAVLIVGGGATVESQPGPPEGPVIVGK